MPLVQQGKEREGEESKGDTAFSRRRVKKKPSSFFGNRYRATLHARGVHRSYRFSILKTKIHWHHEPCVKIMAISAIDSGSFPSANQRLRDAYLTLRTGMFILDPVRKVPWEINWFHGHLNSPENRYLCFPPLGADPHSSPKIRRRESSQRICSVRNTCVFRYNKE